MMDDELTKRIIAALIEVHIDLGPGLLESIYEETVCHEFDLSRIKYERQVAIDVVYKGKKITGQRIDLVVEGEVIIELKAVTNLPEVAMAQTLSYLKATGLKRALLVNFNEKRLIDGLKRISL